MWAATGGSYHLKGRAVTGLPAADEARERNGTGVLICEVFILVSDMSVFENVELPLTYRGEIQHKSRRDLVAAALEKVKMTERQKHFPSEVAGGQQQGVAIARALVGQPKVLLADEPTGNLDSKNAELIMELLGDLHEQGSAVVMVTHDPRWAEHAERQVSLFDGKIVDDRR